MKPQASIHDTKCQIIQIRGLTMKENFLVDLSKQFAVDAVRGNISKRKELACTTFKADGSLKAMF